jgi:hypothetical protein
MDETGEERRRGIRAVSLGAVLLLVFGAAAAYQLGKPKHTTFRRGGAFVSVQKANRSVVASPTGDVAALPAVDAGAIPDFSAATRAPALPGGASSTSTTLAAAGAKPAATSLASGPLALGAYTYAVSGSESATGFGSRQYPSTMTLTAHTAPGLGKDQAVHDLSFSAQHQERAIIAYRNDAVALTFEGGSITFGPATQTSEADYAPAMVQIPLPLRAGDARAGTTEAKAKNGSVARTEDWAVKVVGQETLKLGGQSIPTWVVTIDRKTRPGSADQAQRSRTYWYDPARRIWVKWKEKMHGERKTIGFTFTYDTTYEATFTRFAPA